MRAFTQAQEIFDGDQSASQPKNYVDSDKAPESQPGKRGAIDAKPHCLPHDDIGISGRVIGKAAMKKVDDGQEQTRERREREDEETPSRPNVWVGLGDEQI